MDILANKFGNSDLLSMWVADMDFKEPECVTAALRKYVDEIPFGYYVPPASYFEAFIEWEQTYDNYKVEPEWICFAPEGGAGNQFGHSVFHTASGSGDRAHTGVLSFP